MAINATTLPMVIPASDCQRGWRDIAFFHHAGNGGQKTSVSTITRSSTISQPMAICPRWLSRSCRSSRAAGRRYWR
ncbi:hypothetical protein KCP77_19660 [Salmonella enterica subsp. enterica]|nr:hypothetical protein KCP77_19660 [Salmonella enterica subsp. enterica]